MNFDNSLGWSFDDKFGVEEILVFVFVWGGFVDFEMGFGWEFVVGVEFFLVFVEENIKLGDVLQLAFKFDDLNNSLFLFWERFLVRILFEEFFHVQF